jgi:hypothetical protein
MDSIVKSVLKKYLDEDGLIKIPDKFKRVNLDVGTSNNAPYSEYWLSNDNIGDLCVFGFEPNPYNVKLVFNGNTEGIYGGEENHYFAPSFWPIHLNTNRINDTFFMVECALSNGDARHQPFYCTDDGVSGCSSLYKPLKLNFYDQPIVPVISLKDFFDVFPWEQIPHIDILKVDAQSEDFNVIKGCGDFLSDRIATLMVETNTGNQYENQENVEEFKSYIENCGFICERWDGDGMFYNKKYESISKLIDHTPH